LDARIDLSDKVFRLLLVHHIDKLREANGSSSGMLHAEGLNYKEKTLARLAQLV
jgi:hypothetical protein